MKNKKILLFGGIGAGVLIIALAATFFLIAPKLGKSATTIVKIETPISHFQLGSTYTMQTRVVNLADPGATRYLQIQVVLEFSDPQSEVSSIVASREVVLQDMLTTILGAETTTALQTDAGKTALKTAIETQFASVLYELHITDVLFPTFVMQ